MATGSGLIGSGGGAASGYNKNSNSHRGSSNSSSRNNRGTTAGSSGSGRKKFGKNLNKVLSKTPAAPPVPVISTSGGSQSLFGGSSSSNNGLLLLSTKSKTSSGGSSGLLQPLGSAASSSSSHAPSTAAPSAKTAHDALLLSAAGVAPGEEGGKKASGPVWGRESKQTKQNSEGGEQEEKKPAAALSVTKKAPIETVVPVQQLGDDVQKLNLNKRDAAEKPIVDSAAATEQKVAAVDKKAEKPPAKKSVIETKKQPLQKSKDDEMAAYMSKLAKQRAEKIQSEEEARTLQQKEAAALRLKELEDKKRLAESKKKQTPPLSSSSSSPPPPPKQNPVARRDASKPSSNIVLEPLGKSKKNTVAPSSKPKTPVAEKNKKLYDPERPYSSLVGGSNSNTKSNKKGDKQNSKDKKDDKPVLVHLDSLDDHGRRNNAAESAGGPRMLFDPTSGSMVKASKKVKQQSPKVSDDTAEKLRHVDKSLRREKKGGGGGRKDDSAASNTPTSSHAKKDRKAQKQLAMQRIPRTCGVLFKLDKNGNYINVDRCEADNGYGAHLVPGGRIRNPTAHAQLLDEERILHEQQAHTEGSLNANAESFSFRNDPGFVQHQTEFEAQQQKILEDAWASLVETEEQHQHEDIEEKKPKAKTKSSVDDDYAAALAMSPSMIGLNFDQNDISDSIMLPPSIKANAKPKNTAEEPSVDFQSFGFSSDNDAATSNPFGGGLWGNTSGGNNLGGLSGWDFTSTSSENQDSKCSTTSKLNLWGSGVLESPRKESSDKPSSNALG